MDTLQPEIRLKNSVYNLTLKKRPSRPRLFINNCYYPVYNTESPYTTDRVVSGNQSVPFFPF